MGKEIDVKSKFLGTMVGSALGDAIGEMAFSGSGEKAIREKIEKTETLIYTDDTAMAIGLAESLALAGQLDPQHLGKTFEINYTREPWRGYASGPPTVFALVRQKGLSYTQAARSLFGNRGSFGNGAAMRVAPAGLVFHDAPDLYDKARTSAEVTHAHPIGVDGAAVLAKAVALAVTLSPQEAFPSEHFSEALAMFAQTPEVRDKMIRVRALLAQGIPPSEAATDLGQSVAVQESMPFAVYSFLRHPDAYDACLFCAIMNNGDRDTLGAMACAISGAYLGLEAIPRAWVARLENRPYIENLAKRLFEMKKRSL
jgi:poly(ADP-ribose) glycohydrolase ARH3